MSTRESLIAHRYAAALMSPDAEAETSQRLADALDALVAAARDPALAALLADPRVPPDDRLGVLGDVARAQQAPEPVMGLLRALTRARRLPLLPAVAARLREMVETRFRMRRAVLRIAHRPTPGLLAEITDALSRRLGERVELDVVEDPALIGGFRIQAGEHLVEADLAGRLTALAARLVAELPYPAFPPHS